MLVCSFCFYKRWPLQARPMMKKFFSFKKKTHLEKSMHLFLLLRAYRPFMVAAISYTVLHFLRLHYLYELEPFLFPPMIALWTQNPKWVLDLWREKPSQAAAMRAQLGFLYIFYELELFPYFCIWNLTMLTMKVSIETHDRITILISILKPQFM